jgi:two-component system cell cycle response regulator DivK
MKNETILYIEDNPDNRLLIRRILEAEGYRFIEAENAFEAKRCLSKEVPDLILMDISIPGIDGIEATRIIKANPETEAIPVVALTANAMRGDRERFLAAGCDNYLPKPISTPDLLRVIREYLD